MRQTAVVVVLLAGACSFSARLGSDGGDGGPDASEPDAPPANPSVHFTAITPAITALRPGLYGFEIEVVLRNDLDVEITNVAPSLGFTAGTTDRDGDFRWRDVDRREGVTAPHVTTIAAGGEATFRFAVDALPWAVPPGPIEINGVATFSTGGMPQSAAPLPGGAPVAFDAINPTIVVDELDDELDGDTEISFREALVRANTTSGFDRISFDPAVFPPGSITRTVLDENLGELPANVGDLVIDGSGAGFALAVDSNWETPSGRWGLRVSSGTLVVSGIRIQDMGYNYPLEDVSSNNCGSGNQREGGAIRVDGGTLILDGTTFSDVSVGERNCYASSVRIEGGSGHRILNSTWTDQVMDALLVDAPVIEISGNVMNAGASPQAVDECIFIASQGTADLWIIGNVCVDQEFSAVIANGSSTGRLHVVHNTFVRDGRTDLGAIRRGNDRAITFRNNAYVANTPAAIIVNNGGAGLDISHEAVAGTLCQPACSGATMTITNGDLMLANVNGSTRADFTPQAGSPLVGSGLDWIDRNGSTPGRFNGNGPERGAVELP